ncbi:phasin family protein [Lichenibacterium ramalinae]|nr:phasin family protein [Lichenibacterium ramalinae]
MSSDTFHADAPADPEAGTAVIHPVTPEMMDEAAHKAAQLADDVAHHVVPAPEAAHEASHRHGDDHAPEAPAPELPISELPVPEAPVPELPVAAMTEAVEAGESVMRDAVEVRSAAGSAMVAAAETVDDAARAAADRAEAALDRASAAAGAGMSGGTDALGQYNAALLGMVQANLSATGELFAALVKAKSLPEVVAINTDHLRRQFDTLTAQGRDLATLAQKLTSTAFGPLAGTLRRDA